MNGVVIFNFIVNVTYSGVFIVNFEYISHFTRHENMKNTEIRIIKVSLIDQIANWSVFLPEYTKYNPSPHPNISPSNFSFVLCLYGQGIITGF